MEIVEHVRLPGHPQRRPHARGGGGRRPARRGRDGAAPPPVRPGRAPGDRGRGIGRDARPAASASSTSTTTTSRSIAPRSTSRACGRVHALDRPDLKDEPVAARSRRPGWPRPRRRSASIFAVIREGDVLVHHPYDSFATSVEEFIRQAADDPHVLAIKMTLYRTSGDSPIVRSPHPGGRAGHAGGGAGRAEGALRRGGQHHLGQGAGGGRRPRRLRPGRVEDPLQDAAGGARASPTASAATSTSARATTTPRPPGSTRTSAC